MKKRMLSVLVAFLMLGSQCGAVMAEELVPDVGTTAIESDFAEEDLSFETQEVLPAYEEVLPSAEEELSHNHHFKWWFGKTPPRAMILLA